MYETQSVLRRELHVCYPGGEGRIVLRTDLDWDRNLEPTSVSSDGATSTFALEARKPFLYFKARLEAGDGSGRWSVGPNMLVLMTSEGGTDVYPYFEGDEGGSFSSLVERDSAILGRKHLLRVYLPPGYHQNPLRSYPVVYMQDGKNLFFPDEAFQGRDWQVNEALGLLDAMNAVDRAIVVGIHSGDRMAEYTKPGYEEYARSIVEEITPEVARRFRVLGGPGGACVIGSSLGGVASFYMAWQYPAVFGYAACMSSTFSHRDDLIDRVLAEPKSAAKFYLDSGWPGDNYEVTLAMAMALSQRGYRVREDFLHLAFPLDEHDERAWGKRLHLPLQLGLGRPNAAIRARSVQPDIV
jgi:predicted alpha/beta superfamily hydrolase